jgi:hypothetical protein
MDSPQDNYDKAMELLEHATREADMAMETIYQTAAFQKRIAELEKALVELYGILIPEAQPFPGSDSDLATYAAKTLPPHVRGRLNLLQEENKRRLELLDSANLVIRQTCEARDAAMRPADQIRYLGRGVDGILTDLFRRVHKAADRIAASSEKKETDGSNTH